MAFKLKITEIQLFIIIGLVLFCAKAEITPDSIIVALPFGSIRGYSNGYTWQFNAIPYAKPPVGKLRWNPPEHFIPWKNILDGKDFPAGCPQNCFLGCSCASKTSEDCLYLNVYVPLEWNPKSTHKYNILLFIHGGGFVRGTSGCVLYDSKFFSRNTDSIIVTFNYRLGALGFLRQNEFGIMGNMGIKDQRMAMKWVRSYISYFGGGNNIVLFGESAGAISVGIHMVSPLSEGLFDAVITESNLWTCPLKNTIRSELLGSEFTKILNCDNADCMYNKTEVEIIEAQSNTKLSSDFVDMIVWGPIIDGIDLKEQPYAALINGADKQLKMRLTPAIIGTNVAEGLLFVGMYNDNITKDIYEQLINAAFPAKAPAVIELYSPFYNASEGYDGLLAQIMTDYTFYCSSRNATRTLAIAFMDEPQKNVWEYVWDQGINSSIVKHCQNKPCHGVELFYLFNVSTRCGFTFNQSQINLGYQIEQYWGNFAKGANPNMNNQNSGSAKLLNWQNYDIKSGSQLYFVLPNNRMISDYRKKFCDFWDTIGYIRDDKNITFAEQHPVEVLKHKKLEKSEIRH